MCSALLKTAASPISTSLGRSALGGGVGAALIAASKRKKLAAAVAPKPVLEPTLALRNSSLFNNYGGG